MIAERHTYIYKEGKGGIVLAASCASRLNLLERNLLLFFDRIPISSGCDIVRR